MTTLVYINHARFHGVTFGWKKHSDNATLLVNWDRLQLEPPRIDAMIATTVTEAEILADVLSPNQGDFTAEVAQVVLNWKFSRRSTAHINALARRNQKGTISAAEREELERYLRVGSFLNLLQTKARLSLTASEES